MPQNARNFCTHFMCFSVENSGRSFGNGKNVHFQQNVRDVMTSCVTLALRDYIWVGDIVNANSRYQSLTHLIANL